jgi:glucokinase
MTASSARRVQRAKASLVADVGGTRARFALLDAAGALGPASELTVADFATPLAAIRSFLAGAGEPRLAAAALAIAAPVQGEVVSLTNATWSFDRAELKAALGLDELLLLNDFTALALALPALETSELRQVGGGAARPEAPKALLGPGTGLGVSGLLRHGEAWVPLAGEGGHVTLVAADEREAAIIALARREWSHVSAERLVSGSGLPLLHRLVAQVDGRAVSAGTGTAAQIVAGALSGEASCTATIEVFCSLLGTLAGNLVLTLGAEGGLYIGGGIVPRLGHLFETSLFRQRFEAKGRYQSFLASVPAYVILAPSPALRGAARLLIPPSAARPPA